MNPQYSAKQSDINTPTLLIIHNDIASRRGSFCCGNNHNNVPVRKNCVLLDNYFRFILRLRTYSEAGYVGLVNAESHWEIIIIIIVSKY